jgi:hypothetical protein
MVKILFQSADAINFLLIFIRNLVLSMSCNILQLPNKLKLIFASRSLISGLRSDSYTYNKMQTSSILEMAVFWNVVPHSLVKTDQCFRDAHYLHHQSDKFYETTQRNIPEDRYRHTCHYENVKSHLQASCAWSVM